MNDKSIPYELGKEVKDLNISLSYLLENNLIEIKNLSKDLYIISQSMNYDNVDVIEEIEKYLQYNNEYALVYKNELISEVVDTNTEELENKIKYYKDKINNLTEEKQLEIFRDYKLTEKSIVEELVYALTKLDKNLVLEELTYYGYIK